MKRILLLAVIVLGFACSTQSQEVKSLQSPQEFAETMKQDNVYLLDVRTALETEDGTIEGAHILDYFADDFKTEVDKLPKDKTILVYCASGGRSGETADLLKEKGYTVVDLDGGYRAWLKAFGSASKE